MDNLSRHLASHFWSTIEKLAPGQADLRIDGELYRRWRKQVAVRAFYTDLQAWAAAEPEQWAIWVAPCSASDAEVRGFGVRKRRVKERMDDRTRQRQPLLSPKMLPRLDEIEADLLARRALAEREAWLGEVEGIDLTLTYLRQKRQETKRLTRITRQVDLGIPAIGTDE